jgi:trypsin
MRARTLTIAAALLAMTALGSLPASGGAATPSPRIIGGSVTPPGGMGFTGAVIFGGGAPKADRKRETCTATLVAPQVAITAAHCFLAGEVFGPVPFISPDKLTFVFGKQVLASPDAGQRAKVANVFIPINFRPAGPLGSGDFAVVHLDHALSGVPTAPLIPPALEGSGILGQIGTFAGWGIRRPFARDAANALRQGSGTIVPTAQCAGPKFIKRDNAFLCLAGKSMGAVCHGDSGGPLVVGGYLVGVTNYTLANCSSRGPTEGFASMAPSGPNYTAASAAVANPDTTPPVMTVTQPLPAPLPRGHRSARFSFSFDEPVRAICTRGRRAVSCARGTSGTVRVEGGKKAGPGVIRVIAFDQWFNRTQVDVPFTVG